MKLALMVDVPHAIPGDSYVRVPVGPYRETLALAADMGFDGVEILIDHPDTVEIQSLLAAAAKTGLAIAAINSGRLYFEYGLALVSTESAIRQAAREALLGLARLTAPFKAPINIGVFRGLPGPGGEGKAAGELAALLRETADEIAELDVTLVLEPGNEAEFPFIYSTSGGMALVEEVNRPNVALMLDTFHMSVEKETISDSLTAARAMLRHIHFLDRDRNPPSAASRDFDLSGILQTLCRQRYSHYLSMPLLQNGDIAGTADIVAALKTAVRQHQFTEDSND